MMTPTKAHPFLRWAGAAALAGLLALAGCGGGGGGGGSSQAQLRAINLTSDLASVDLLFGDKVVQSALAANVISNASAVNAGTQTLNVRANGSSTTLFSSSFSLSGDKNYTAVIWGRENALRLATLPEDEDDGQISSGNARVRIFNATIDSGSVDVFITPSSTDIVDATPTQGAVGSGTLSGFRDVSQGTYRLRVTGAGDPNDLRLDVPAITLASGKHHTLVVTAGGSGVLVHGTLIQQKAAVTSFRNTQARVRVVASVDSAGAVSVVAGTRTLAASQRSPSIGQYALVDAGNPTVTVSVNGNPVSTGARALTAGDDYTLLAHGTLAAPQVRLITDDNRLPTNSARSRIRLINGTSAAAPQTLAMDFSPIAVDIGPGSASSYVTVVSNSAVKLDVTTASSVQPLYTVSDVNLRSLGLYTVFMLGGNDTVTGLVRKER